MNNQISSSPKLPFFYRYLPIILGAIIVIIIAGGIFAWQYFVVPEEIIPAEKEIVDGTITVKIPVILLEGATREDRETSRMVGCGDSIAFIEKEIEYTPKPLTAIYQILFSGDEITEGTKYHNPIISLVRGRRMNGVVFALRFERVMIKDNIATVYLSGDYLSLGTCEPPRVEAVLSFAAKQFPWIEDVDIFINGAEAGAVFVHGGPGFEVLWGWNYCTPESPCNIGEGDCDSDADCGPGLFCAQNVGTKYDQRAIVDVCEKR